MTYSDFSDSFKDGSWQVFDILQTLGLQISAESGGCQKEEYCPVHIEKTLFQDKLFLENGEILRVMDPAFFLKTLMTTEETLKLTLFR